MNDPVLVEVLRADRIESFHRGAVAVVDGDGRLVFERGDIERPVFPRSAVKAIQALPLVESGAADAFGFDSRQLAMACASHGGEPAHVETALSMLTRAHLDGRALECGTHWPSHQGSTLALARAGGAPNDLHNNCSGKHSGFLCTCRHLGIEHHGYVHFGHRSQEMVREAMQGVTSAPHTQENMGTDGCSIPTYAVPLRSLALGFARMATGNGLGQRRSKAAKRLLAACMAEPFHVAGSGTADTDFMTAGNGRVFVKTGAEGVYCAAVPERGIGIALKCDDGHHRAAEVTVAAVLSILLKGDGLSEVYAEKARPGLRNRKSLVVGSLRPSEALRA